MSEIPNDPKLRALLESGHGYTEHHDHGDIQTGFHYLSLEEMEAMGEAERERLGLTTMYEFALAHPPREEE